MTSYFNINVTFVVVYAPLFPMPLLPVHNKPCITNSGNIA